MTQLPSPDDVLMGGGARAAQFNNPGDSVGGRIIGKPTSYHVREYDRNNPGGGALAYFPSGDPIIGIKVDVQSGARVDGDDDGTRRLYVEKKRQLAAVREAVRASGASGLEVGGFLFLTLTGHEQGEGSVPAMTWAATYRPPALMVPGGAPPAPQQPQQQQQQPAPVGAVPYGMPQQYQNSENTSPQPVPQPAPAQPGASNVITESVATAMRNAGIDTSAFTVVPG